MRCRFWRTSELITQKMWLMMNFTVVQQIFCWPLQALAAARVPLGCSDVGSDVRHCRG